MCDNLSAAQSAKFMEEIRETDGRREQSMQQFKEWISKHSFISNTATWGEFKSAKVLLNFTKKIRFR
jgi:hypothetical protein